MKQPLQAIIMIAMALSLAVVLIVALHYRSEAEEYKVNLLRSQTGYEEALKEIDRRGKILDSLSGREAAERILFESYLESVRNSKGRVNSITDRYEKLYHGLDTLGPVELRRFITDRLEARPQ